MRRKTIVLLILIFAFGTVILAQDEIKQPKVEGSEPFKLPENIEKPTVSKEDFEKTLSINLSKVKSPTVDSKNVPKSRTRSDELSSERIRQLKGYPAGFQGRTSIRSFTNWDMTSDAYMRNRACGQAALATAFWAVGLGANYNNDPNKMAKDIFRVVPPKITVGGVIPVNSLIGTDWRQMNWGIEQWKNFKVKYTWITGETQVKEYLRKQYPVVVMLDCGNVSNGPCNKTWFTGHWITLFAYDDKGYYATNIDGNWISNENLRGGWSGNLAKGHGTESRGLLIWKE